MNNYLEFEKPIEEIDNKIKSLQQSETGEIETIKNYQELGLCLKNL